MENIEKGWQIQKWGIFPYLTYICFIDKLYFNQIIIDIDDNQKFIIYIIMLFKKIARSFVSVKALETALTFNPASYPTLVETVSEIPDLPEHQKKDLETKKSLLLYTQDARKLIVM